MNLQNDWKKVRSVQGYLGSPFSMTLEFSDSSSKLRVSVEHGDVVATQEVGELHFGGRRPNCAISNALAAGSIRLDGDVEAIVGIKARALMAGLKNEGLAGCSLC